MVKSRKSLITVEEVNKRVDDIMNMPKLSPFEQALTNFIGDWEDDEEHWPSKFVKKHGKYILDIAREELQKEQKPAEWSEEDEKIYQTIFGHFNSYENYICSTGVKKEHILSWLKSLRPSWKPSKEQMGAVKHAYNSFPNDCSTKSNLKLLYHDLEKLM